MPIKYYSIEFDILFQGEGKFERSAKAVLGLPETDISFFNPQDAQTMLEIFYPERIIEVTSIERIDIK